ncbi:MAG: serine hydrolase, partial [Saprospiraceae bacterium]|nr:serine hydrolase [Saprospiraceae bacterium]
MKKYISILVLFCNTILTAQNAYFPDKNWETRTPFELNMNAALVDSAVSFALNNEVKLDYDLRIANLKSYVREPDYKILGPMRHRGKPAGVILKNGYIVAKWGDIDRVDMTFSVTKSYLATIAGLAVDSKLINNVDEKVAQYVWDGTFEGAHNASITWRHLLTQSSDWSG